MVMTAQKEQLKSAGMAEIAELVQTTLSETAQRAMRTVGEVAGLQALNQWFEGYLNEVTAKHQKGELDKTEYGLVISHLTAVGTQLLERVTASGREAILLEGETRACHTLAVTVSQKLELSQALMHQAAANEREVEERRQQRDADKSPPESEPDGSND